MMISRRCFLLGAGAALAATQLPSVLINQRTSFASTPLDVRFKYRSVQDIMFGGDLSPDDIEQVLAKKITHTTFSIFKNENQVFNVSLDPRSMFRWVAAPDGEIIMRENDVMRIELMPAFSRQTMNMIYDTNPEAGKRPRCPEYLRRASGAEPRWYGRYVRARYGRKYERQAVVENISWVDGVVESKNVCVLDLRDSYLVAT